MNNFDNTNISNQLNTALDYLDHQLCNDINYNNPLDINIYEALSSIEMKRILMILAKTLNNNND